MQVESNCKLFISSLSDYYRTVFSFLSRGNESLVIFMHVNQLIMRVRKPKVEYKLALQEKPKGAPWRIIV